ncbi:hypothetical protein JTE90_025985 [Oedothorax gibbosus]|uniref:Cuticle protein n=1 Tax=Oedothorax gibbosus TaxID=931172 RepID=A0AAV6U7L4_9ARAC|nr:hypothetical protein JTE90_025985 [Oedothorax gibbosus]
MHLTGRGVLIDTLSEVPKYVIGGFLLVPRGWIWIHDFFSAAAAPGLIGQDDGIARVPLCTLSLFAFQLLILGVAVNACLAISRDNQFSYNKNNEVKEEEKYPPIPYNFEYNSRDDNGTTQFRKETSDSNGKVTGRYGYKDQYGIERIVEYTADENGYRAEIKTNEPGTMNKNPASVLYNAQPTAYAAETDFNKKAELQNSQTFASEDKSPVLLSQPQAANSRQYFFGGEQPQIATSSAATSNDEGAKQYTFFGLNDAKKEDSVATFASASSGTDEKSSLAASKEQTSFQYSAPQQLQYVSGNQQQRFLVSPVNQHYQYEPQHHYATVQHGHIPARSLVYSSIPQNVQPLAYSNVHQNAQPLAFSNIHHNAQPVLIQYAPQPLAYQTGIPTSAHPVPAYNLVNYGLQGQQFSSPSKTQ